MDSLAKTAKVEFRWKEILTPWEATHCSPIPAVSWAVIYWAQEVSWKRDKGKEIRRAPPPLEERYHTRAPYFQADLLCWHHCCCLSYLGTTRQAVDMFFKSGTLAWAPEPFASHLLSPPQSRHFYSYLPSPANLQLEHSLLFLENKVICCLLCKEAKHKTTKKFADCSVLSNGLLSFHLQGK